MLGLLAIIDSIVGIGILIGVWWGNVAAHNGDLREMIAAFQDFLEKNSIKKE